MKTTTHLIKRLSPILMAVVIFLVLVFSAVIAYRLISGESLGVRSFVRDKISPIVSQGKFLSKSSEIQASSNGSYTNILFLHHSVGAGFINEGHLRDKLTQKGYALWDQDYIDIGLRDPAGKFLGYTYNIPGDNTDPDGLYTLFSQERLQAPTNGLSQVLQHEVIIFKSCYPNSNIEDDHQIETLKKYYLGIRDMVDHNPDRFFILLTSPPLNPAATDADNAARARSVANWLVSDAFLGERENLAVFDLFDILAKPDLTQPDGNMLREAFRVESDSHPNTLANENVAKSIADFVDQKVSAYRDIIE